MQFRIEAKGDHGEIFILSDIGESWFSEGVTAKQIAEDLKKLDNAKTIDVSINSYGGDLFDGLTMYTMLNAHSAKITSKVLGIAASAASVVAMAGDTIEITESGTLMIHDAISGVMGNSEDMARMSKILDEQSQRMADLYAARSKKTAAEVREKMRAETWFSAQEAIDFGLADAIIPNLKVAACALPKIHPFKNTPALTGQAPAPIPIIDRQKAIADRLTMQSARHSLARLRVGAASASL